MNSGCLSAEKRPRVTSREVDQAIKTISHDPLCQPWKEARKHVANQFCNSAPSLSLKALILLSPPPNPPETQAIHRHINI